MFVERARRTNSGTWGEVEDASLEHTTKSMFLLHLDAEVVVHGEALLLSESLWETFNTKIDAVVLHGVEEPVDVLLPKLQPPHMRCFGEVGVERLQDELRVRGAPGVAVADDGSSSLP